MANSFRIRVSMGDRFKVRVSIDVWENFCQGRQNPILRPNEI